MKKVFIQDNWKESWKASYPYDLLEVFGDVDNPGYAYAYENRTNFTLSCIEQILKTGDRILDVAAAQGNFSLRLAELGYKVTWNDIRADLSEYVEMKREKGDIEYKPGNVFTIQFNEPFDLVLATEIIEHVAHPDKFLENLSTLVKPGGYVLITTPMGSYFTNHLPKFSEFENPAVFESKQFGPNSEDHIFLLYLDEINTLAERSGLEVMDIKYYTNFLTNGHLKLNGLLKFLPKKVVFKFESFTQSLPPYIGTRIHNNFLVLFRKTKD